ncbi:MAG: hypothetical protein ACQKBV_07195 [Puniceicoccales bacterium]
MNILFLEDEVELNAIGVEQLRNLDHTVYPALDLADARAIVDEHWQTLHLIIADHRLPDGRGIDYLLEIKSRYPRIKLAVVSGCLSPDDEETLAMAEIPFFRKPLLYRQVMKKLREHYMIHTRPPIPTTKKPPTPPSPASTSLPPKAPPPPPGKPTADNGILATNGANAAPTPKRKGLTSVIFSKLTRKDS